MKYNVEHITQMAKALYREEKAKTRLDGWFLAREIVCDHEEEYTGLSREMKAAKELESILKELPLSLSENAIFAGSQSDAFSRTYALINPSFRVETFSGYCDPTAIFSDIEPNDEFTKERIERVKNFTKQSDYVRALTKVYDTYENYTAEVVFFIEQVTGHIIPDFRPVLKYGLRAVIAELDERIAAEAVPEKQDN